MTFIVDKKILVPIIFSIVLLSVPVNQAYAAHCNVTHLKTCFDDIKDAIDKIALDIQRIPGDILATETKIIKDVTAEIHIVQNDVNAVEEKVVAIENTIDHEVILALQGIESDVAKVEKAVTDDITEDVSIIKEDIAKIDKLVASVERIEKRVVDTTEEVIKAIIGDIKSDFVYIIYGILAIAAAYVIIRIVQFAIWLKAYLTQDGIEHAAKRQVEQNDEIISLLTKLVTKEN